MGLIRKTLFVSSAGLVRANSKKQRVAKAQLQEMREQTKILREGAVDPAVEARGQAALARSRELQRIAKEKAAAEKSAVPGSPQPVTELPPEGWYPDPDREHLLRWWDGQNWTARTAPRV